MKRNLVNRDKVRKLAREGADVPAIAFRLAVSRAVVYRILREARKEVATCG
jgi:transposase